jgi:hypothetical protein
MRRRSSDSYNGRYVRIGARWLMSLQRSIVSKQLALRVHTYRERVPAFLNLC